MPSLAPNLREPSESLSADEEISSVNTESERCGTWSEVVNTTISISRCAPQNLDRCIGCTPPSLRSEDTGLGEEITPVSAPIMEDPIQDEASARNLYRLDLSRGLRRFRNYDICGTWSECCAPQNLDRCIGCTPPSLRFEDTGLGGEITPVSAPIIASARNLYDPKWYLMHTRSSNAGVDFKRAATATATAADEFDDDDMPDLQSCSDSE
ncbi:hypothetical protein DFH07DRAFT_775789 [Mycena maculata]|uniref:Uncharacterized protein n=1 Tax=Mycena maculata TaxID=230809 RepID=A0AAD7IQ70_9AGAR|nr:hypothetical protein DFH07DRAFT_775789 [Mycena maculata]